MIRLVRADVDLLDAAIAGDGALARALGHAVAPGWATFREALRPTGTRSQANRARHAGERACSSPESRPSWSAGAASRDHRETGSSSSATRSPNPAGSEGLPPPRSARWSRRPSLITA